MPNTQVAKTPGGDPGKHLEATSAAFVRALGYPLQLVALHPETGKVIVHHAADDTGMVKAMQQMKRLNAEGWNDYYETNPGARGRRSKSCDITHVRAVVGDVDATNGRSVQDCVDAAAALQMLPTFTLATGGGVQVVYLLDELVPASPETVAIHEAVGRAIRDKIDGDAVFDLARIMRMPGFVNWPNAKKRATGRKPVKAKVLSASGRTYSLAELAHAFVLPATIASVVAPATLNGDLSGGRATAHWFDGLAPDDKNACLAEMLQVPDVVALADTSDGASPPNWRTVLAACARSGAPNAYALCRAWAQASSRFDPRDFDNRYRSYCHD